MNNNAQTVSQSKPYALAGIQAGIVCFLILLFKEVILYITRINWLLSPGSLLLFILLFVAVLLTYVFIIGKGPLSTRFKDYYWYSLSALVALAVCRFTFLLLLHHGIDPSYKYDLAKIQLDALTERLKEVELANRIDIEDPGHTDFELFAEQYSVAALAQSTGTTLLLSAFCAFFIAILLYYMHRMRSQRRAR